MSHQDEQVHIKNIEDDKDGAFLGKVYKVGYIQGLVHCFTNYGCYHVNDDWLKTHPHLWEEDGSEGEDEEAFTGFSTEDARSAFEMLLTGDEISIEYLKPSNYSDLKIVSDFFSSDCFDKKLVANVRTAFKSLAEDWWKAEEDWYMEEYNEYLEEHDIEDPSEISTKDLEPCNYQDLRVLSDFFAKISLN